MSFQHITYDVADAVAIITLNRPERLNACSPAMADEVLLALDRAHGGGEARAVLITGAGRAFCSGLDLQAAPESSGIEGRGSYVGLMQHYNPLLMKLVGLPIPVVAAVNGAAAGIGSSIALASDFVVAARSAYFLQAWVNIGLAPDGGATWMLPRLVGRARAAEMVMLGEKVGADKAEAWGLIHRCVDDAALRSEAVALAARLAAGPTVALGIMRQNMARAFESDFASALVAEAEGAVKARVSANSKRGTQAFLERRKPVFEGN